MMMILIMMMMILIMMMILNLMMMIMTMMMILSRIMIINCGLEWVLLVYGAEINNLFLIFLLKIHDDSDFCDDSWPNLSSSLWTPFCVSHKTELQISRKSQLLVRNNCPIQWNLFQRADKFETDWITSQFHQINNWVKIRFCLCTYFLNDTKLSETNFQLH